MTPDQIVSSIRSKTSWAVLLLSDDELSTRAKQTFVSLEARLQARGFQTTTLDVSVRSSAIDELACVRVPQLRFFVRGRLQSRVIGVFDESDIDVALQSLG